MVDYLYYANSFGGEKIPTEMAFNTARKKAEAYLGHFTFDRFLNDMDSVNKIKACLCEMCDVIYMSTKDMKDGREKKSENTDGYSVTYVTENVDGQDFNKILEEKLYRVADLYLGNTDLLYIGL